MFDPPIFHPKVELESGIADLGFSSWRSPVSLTFEFLLIINYDL